MNSNSTVIGGIVVVLLLIGGAFWYMQSNPPVASPTATSTPTGTGENTTPTGTNPPVAGSPTATTNANVISSDTTAVVVGGVVPNGALTTYWYDYGTSVNLGSKTTAQTIGSGFTELAAPTYIKGLQKNTTYYFRLNAQNQFGSSSGTTYTFTTTNTGALPPVGSAPTGKTLAATGVARTNATINGSVNPNQSSTLYWFEYGKTTSLGQIVAVQQVGSGSATLPASAALSSLDPLTTYYFRLNAQNQFGTVNGATLTFKTTGPAALSVPTGVTRTANAIGTSTATLRGSVTASLEATFYWFEYSTDSGFASASLKTTPQKSAAVSTGTVSVDGGVSALQSRATYYYRIVAQNSIGTVRGSSVSFKTK